MKTDLRAALPLSARAALLSLLTLSLPLQASAFCGFFVSGADSKLYNDATQVVLMRKGQRTVMSMSNTYKGPTEDFAMVVPVPVVLKKEQVQAFLLVANFGTEAKELYVTMRQHNASDTLASRKVLVQPGEADGGGAHVGAAAAGAEAEAGADHGHGAAGDAVLLPGHGQEATGRAYSRSASAEPGFGAGACRGSNFTRDAPKARRARDLTAGPDQRHRHHVPRGLRRYHR